MNIFDTLKQSLGLSKAQRIAYGTEKLQFGDLYLPEREGPHPVIILIHGGFWRTGYGLSLMDGLASSLARRGMAAWNIEYRRVGDIGGGWPNTLLDVAHATDHLREIAPTYQLNLQHVIPVGHSAGGHLAFWLAARHRLPQGSPLAIGKPLALAAAVSLAGAVDLEHTWRLNLGGGAASALLGGGYDAVPERYRAASPAALLPLGIPQVLIHGTSDDRVPLVVSQDYATRASDAGDNVTLVELPGTDHFALIDARSTAWTSTLREIQKVLP
jgi:acetyl esterase/lipase